MRTRVCTYARLYISALEPQVCTNLWLHTQAHALGACSHVKVHASMQEHMGRGSTSAASLNCSTVAGRADGSALCRLTNLSGFSLVANSANKGQRQEKTQTDAHSNAWMRAHHQTFCNLYACGDSHLLIYGCKENSRHYPPHSHHRSLSSS